MSTPETPESTPAGEIGLHSLAPAEPRKARRRVGRGHGSGHGKTSGRGHKGYGARSGSKARAGFEGGQNPIQSRMRKLRGPNKKTSMPFERFRTSTHPVNLDDLAARFADGAEATLETQRARGLGGRDGEPVKVLARGGETLSAGLTVHAHRFSTGAREAIEAAGGSCVVVEA